MYKETDFSKCLFNPLTDGLFTTYPQLGKIKEVWPAITEKTMKYIICVYDYRSPIVTQNREIKIRKQVAAELSGYDIINDDIKWLFNIESDFLLKSIDTFLKTFIHSRVWYMICCNEHIFYEYGQRMLKIVDNKDDSGKPMTEKAVTEAMVLKTKLSDDMATIDERLDTAYKRLYGDEKADKFINSATTPERIASERKQNVH